jgi:hypothetical protein
MSGVALLDSPASGGGEEVGNEAIMLDITESSGSAVACAGSSVVVVGSSFTSSSPNRTWARSRLRRVVGDRSLSSGVEIGWVVSREMC